MGASAHRSLLDVCWSYDEARIERGHRAKGSRRDVTERPDARLHDFADRW